MPGFKVFKGLGRKKDKEEDTFVPAPSGQSTFRVLAREKQDSLNGRALPLSLDRRSWAGNEIDAGVTNR
jgi:hypothetical protein